MASKKVKKSNPKLERVVDHFSTGWWFGTLFVFLIYWVSILIIPTDELIFFQRGGSTTNQSWCCFAGCYNSEPSARTVLEWHSGPGSYWEGLKICDVKPLGKTMLFLVGDNFLVTTSHYCGFWPRYIVRFMAVMFAGALIIPSHMT